MVVGSWREGRRYCFIPGSFGYRVISVSGKFGPWSFQSRAISNRLISILSFQFGVVSVQLLSVRVISVTGHFGLGSFRSRVSVTGHFGPGSFRSRVF